jgi:hypothetical protein
LKPLRVFDSSVAVLEVLCGQLVPQLLLFGKTLLKLNDLLIEVAVFHIEFLLAHDPVFLVTLNSIVEKSLLALQDVHELISLVGKPVDFFMGQDYGLDNPTSRL